VVRHPCGFFRKGTILDLDDGYIDPPGPDWAEYRNLGSGTLGAVVSARIATLHELQTVYGIADLYLLAEVLKVDAFNERVARRWHESKG
jgi:hypothetical protein